MLKTHTRVRYDIFNVLIYESFLMTYFIWRHSSISEHMPNNWECTVLFFCLIIPFIFLTTLDTQRIVYLFEITITNEIIPSVISVVSIVRCRVEG